MDNITLNDNQLHDDIDEINNLVSTNTTGPNPEDSSTNSKNSSDDSDNESDSDIEQIDPELLKKMQEYQEKEEKENKEQNIIENLIKEPLNIKSHKSIDEIKNESSILTKLELIKLGQTYATENKEKELFEEKKIKVVNFLKKYENIDLDNIVVDIIKNK